VIAPGGLHEFGYPWASVKIGVLPMEIGFWHFLAKGSDDEDALPLKQRIPEVALFRGHQLQACFCSNQRGLLQQRNSSQLSRESLLDRLFALSAKKADAADLSLQTPVAILRRGAGATSPPKAEVLNASQLLELLEGPSASANGGVASTSSTLLSRLDDDEEWSLQSLVIPSTDLRVVAVYSKQRDEEECLDLVGRSFGAVYPLAGHEPWEGAGAPPQAAVAVPNALAAAVEAKTLALVGYVHRFFGRTVESLIAEFVSDPSGRAVLHGFWKVDLSMSEGKFPEKDQQAWAETDSPMLSTALPSTMSMSNASRPTSAGGVSAAAAPSRPGSASKSTEWETGRSSFTAEVLGPGTGAPATSAVEEEPKPGEDFHIEEDDGEDNVFDEAVERISATRPSSRPGSAKGAPRQQSTKVASEEDEGNGAKTGAAAAPRRPLQAPSQPRPSLRSSGASPVQASSTAKSTPRQTQQRRPASLGARTRLGSAPPYQSSSRPGSAKCVPTQPTSARPQRPGSRPRPTSANSRQQQRRSGGSNVSVQSSLPARHTGSSNVSIQLSPRSRTVVSDVRTKQLISRHVSEREARPRMISTLTRQLERFREFIPAFAAQRRAVKELLEMKQQMLSEKIEEVERTHAHKLMLERVHEQQYDLLVHGLERQIQDAKTTSEERRWQLERSFQEEADLARVQAGHEEQNRAIRAALDKTLQQMESVQQAIIQAEARANTTWEPEDKELPLLAKKYRQRDATARHQKQVQEKQRLTRIQLQEADEELASRRDYAKRLEDFIRKISGGGGRYVLPPKMKREAHRLIHAASKLRAAAAREAAEKDVDDL